MASLGIIPKYVLVRNSLDGFVCVDSDNDTKRLLYGACVGNIENTITTQALPNVVIYKGMLDGNNISSFCYKIVGLDMIEITFGNIRITIIVTTDFYGLLEDAGSLLITAFCKVIFDS
jgi:hypothetical protein